MRKDRSVSLVIPARNEFLALPFVLRAVPGWVDEVIVVDNGSTDATAAVARRLGATTLAEPLAGYGAACARGSAYALARGSDIVAYLDADGSDDPRELASIVDPLIERKADLVIGCRNPAPAMARHQRLGTQLVCRLLSWGFGRRVSDLGPFRAVCANTLRELALRDRAFGWTAEMQARALRLGVPIREVPVSWRPGVGRSEISGTLRGTLRAARDLIGCSLREIVLAQRDRRAAARQLEAGRAG